MPIVVAFPEFLSYSTIGDVFSILVAVSDMFTGTDTRKACTLC